MIRRLCKAGHCHLSFVMLDIPFEQAASRSSKRSGRWQDRFGTGGVIHSPIWGLITGRRASSNLFSGREGSIRIEAAAWRSSSRGNASTAFTSSNGTIDSNAE